MKTPEEFLNDISFEKNSSNAYNYLNDVCWKNEFKNKKEYLESTKKAMIAFAAYCCERQRESDAEAAETKTVNPGYMEMDVVDKSSILNNKLITDDYDN